MSDETAMLRECADALDADRGHNASAVTRRIREAADHLDALRADREERQQEQAESIAFIERLTEQRKNWHASHYAERQKRVAAEADREAAQERIERAWELCSWETSTKAEIAAALIPDEEQPEALARLSSANQETP